MADAVTLGPPATRLTIRTDWGTLETVWLSHADRAAAERLFRHDGGPFTGDDWARLERALAARPPGMQVVVWVCEDGVTPPVIDWRLGAQGRPAR